MRRPRLGGRGDRGAEVLSKYRAAAVAGLQAGGRRARYLVGGRAEGVRLWEVEVRRRFWQRRAGARLAGRRLGRLHVNVGQQAAGGRRHTAPAGEATCVGGALRFCGGVVRWCGVRLSQAFAVLRADEEETERGERMGGPTAVQPKRTYLSAGARPQVPTLRSAGPSRALLAGAGVGTQLRCRQTVETEGARGGEFQRRAAMDRVHGRTSPNSHSRARCAVSPPKPRAPASRRRRREPSSYYPRGRHRSPRDDTVSVCPRPWPDVPLGPPPSHPLPSPQPSPTPRPSQRPSSTTTRPRLGHSCMPCTSRLGAATSILIINSQPAWARHWCRPARSSSSLHPRHCVDIVKTAAYGNSACCRALLHVLWPRPSWLLPISPTCPPCP